MSVSNFTPAKLPPHANVNARRVLFDTNIVLDAADKNRPQHHEARTALRYCNGGGDMGLVTPGSLKDAYYILSKRIGKQEAQETVKMLLGLLVVLPFEAESCLIAAGSNEPDFEDGLVRAAAELNGVDLILTRDAEAFRKSTIKKVTCAEYLEMIEGD